MSASPRERVRLLVVEPVRAERLALADALRAAGYATVDTARGCGLALGSLASGPYDVVIIDITTQSGDGLDLLDGIGALPDPPAVVLLSASPHRLLGSVSQLALYLKLRVGGSFHKPLHLPELVDCLDRLVADAEPAAETATDTSKAALLSNAQVRHALQAGEFVPYFQPLYDLRQGVVTAVEALARYVPAHDGEVLAPNRFLPVISKLGLEGALFKQVATCALDSARQWRQQGINLVIGLNIPPSLLESEGFVEQVQALAAAADCPPACLTLELTEYAAVNDAAAFLRAATRLRMEGFGLALDDYGTGYNGLARLRYEPYSQLKIDQRFVRDGESPARASTAVILESSIALSAELGLYSVIEGVETAEQFQRMLELGACAVQGYYVSHPIPGDQVPATVARCRGLR